MLILARFGTARNSSGIEMACRRGGAAGGVVASSLILSWLRLASLQPGGAAGDDHAAEVLLGFGPGPASVEGWAARADPHCGAVPEPHRLHVLVGARFVEQLGAPGARCSAEVRCALQDLDKQRQQAGLAAVAILHASSLAYWGQGASRVRTRRDVVGHRSPRCIARYTGHVSSWKTVACWIPAASVHRSTSLSQSGHRTSSAASTAGSPIRYWCLAARAARRRSRRFTAPSPRRRRRAGRPRCRGRTTSQTHTPSRGPRTLRGSGTRNRAHSSADTPGWSLH